MAKKLRTLLSEHKSDLLREWFDLVVSTYPFDTAATLKKKDAFSNPVGHTTRTSLDALFDELLNGLDNDSAGEKLDPIIRIRAVQDFTPSRAIAFILDFKNIIKKQFAKELKDPVLLNEFVEFARSIDELMLIGINIYVNCREKLYQLKVNTEREKIYSAFSRAGLIVDDPVEAPDPNVS